MKGFYHIWAWRPSWSCDPDAANKILFPPTQGGSTYNLALIGPAVSEKKMFEHCGRRRRRTMDAGPLVYYTTLEGTVLENVDSIKYLGVTITSDLKWNSHIRNVCSKANRTLGFLRRNLFSCPQDVKEAAYKSLVRPILEYGSTVWDPHYNGLNDELENVQKRAARFVTRNYIYETGSMTGILEELKWETLQKRRKDNRLILLYKGLKGKARIPTDDLIPKNRRCRNQHSLVFQIPSASIDAYKKSFFPQSIRDWNVLPDSLISSAELADDCVSKFLLL